MLRKVTRALLGATLYAYHLFAFPLIAATILAWLCTSVIGLSSETSPFTWIVLSPVIYISFLTLTFAVSALNMQIAGCVGWKKPRRSLSFDENGEHSGATIVVSAIIMRAILYWSLPGTRYLLRVPLFDRLILYSYSTHVFLGRESQIWGYIYDPELTTIGDRVIIGGGTAISAHSVIVDPDGRLVYTSSPIKIDDRAVIGGECRIGLGVRIGKDALVEPGSVVAAFSQIPAGEVWAGNPAVFKRHRFDDNAANDPHATTASNRSTGSSTRAGRGDGMREARDQVPTADTMKKLRVIVAEALDIPLESVHDEFSMQESDAWDSLAQLGIAAALNVQFGAHLSESRTYKLQSVPQILDIIQEPHRHSTSKAGTDTATFATVGQGSSDTTLSLPLNPELIPLMDSKEATRLLSNLPRDSVNELEFRVSIASTFTAEPVSAALKLWSRAFGIAADVSFAGFNQIERSLLSPDEGGFRSADRGMRVVLVRPEDLLAANGADRSDDLLKAIRTFGAHSAATLIVSTLPPVVSAFSALERTTVDAARHHWLTALSELQHVELLDFSGIIECLGVAASRETGMEVVARSPYSAAVFRELGIELSRFVRRAHRPAAKVLALDADNTLWGGIVGEDGPDALRMSDDGSGRSFRMFQQWIKRQKENGVLLVLVSRNERADVIDVLQSHPDMLLREEDFAATRINWEPKSSNLNELAAELNLGLDSFVFVDDDPANRAEVTENAPEVTVIPLPDDPALYTETLSALWCFDRGISTNEDRNRTRMQRQQSDREQLKSRVSDTHDWLKSLELTVELNIADERDLPRVAQLAQKTNQFNLSLKRHTFDEVRDFAADHDVITVRASDRFGDYGLIGAVITCRHPPTGTLTIDTFLLSCRAMGRGIEQFMLSEIVELAIGSECRRIQAPFEVGPRNVPIRDFFASAGFSKAEGDGLNSDTFVATVSSLDIRKPTHFKYSQFGVSTHDPGTFDDKSDDLRKSA